MCPGVDSASKNEYQDIPAVKGGRCVRLTTLPPSCAECLVIWSLNRPETSVPHRPVIGVALASFFYHVYSVCQFDIRLHSMTRGFMQCFSLYPVLITVFLLTHSYLKLTANARYAY